MTARHWMQIAALTSALGLTGAAIAHDTNQTTSTDDRSNVSSHGFDTPSSGAIVTPADKAAGMGKDDEQAGNRNGGVNDDTSTSSTSNDDALSVNPGPSNDEDSSVNPGPSNDLSVNPPPSSDDEVTVTPGSTDRDETRYRTPAPSGSVMDRDSASRLDENESGPARIGSDVQPGDMGPSNMRGQ